jgi:hypothetical protein
MITVCRRLVECGLLTAGCHLLATYAAYHTNNDWFELLFISLIVIVGAIAVGIAVRVEKGFWKYFPLVVHVSYFAWMVFAWLSFFSGDTR